MYRYAEFAARIHKTVDFLIDRYDKDGFTFWSRRDQTFIIVYNSDAPEPEIRWTLTHEIGHIQLGHISGGNPLARNGAQNPLLEIEAEFFARRVLCPPLVLAECEVSGPDEVMELCGVPQSRAELISDSIPDVSKDFRTSPLLAEVERQFAPFIDDYKKNALAPTNNARKLPQITIYDFLGGLFLWEILHIKTNTATNS